MIIQIINNRNHIKIIIKNVRHIQNMIKIILIKNIFHKHLEIKHRKAIRILNRLWEDRNNINKKKRKNNKQCQNKNKRKKMHRFDKNLK